MNSFRFIGVGLFAVGLILFAPFFFRFLLFAILIGLAFRLIGGYRRARYGYSYGCGRSYERRRRHPFSHHPGDQYEEDGIVPSD